MHTRGWQGHGFLGFEGASTMVRDAYGDIVDVVDVFGSVVSAVTVLIEDDKDQSMGNTPL